MPQIDTITKYEYLFTKASDKMYEVTGSNQERSFTKFMKKGDTSEVDYRSASIVGFGQHFQKTEVGPIRYDTLTPGRERTTTWPSYALGWRVSDRFWRDAMKSKRAAKGAFKKFIGFTQRARESAEWTMEAIVAFIIDTLNVAATGPLFNGIGSDGKAFAATDHPLIKASGSASNVNGSASLTSTALEDSIALLRRTPDERGRRGGFATKGRLILVVGPINEFKAYQILNTDNVMGTNNNDTMALNKYKRGITVVVVDELDAWDGWLLVDGDRMPLEYFINLEPTFTNQKDFETSVHLFKSEVEFAADFHDWRGVVYNAGT